MGQQETRNEDLTVLRRFLNTAPGPKYQPKYKDGVELPFEPDMALIVKQYGADETAPTEKIRVKYVAAGEKNAWMVPLIKERASYVFAVKRGETAEGKPWAVVEDIAMQYEADGNAKRVTKPNDGKGTPQKPQGPAKTETAPGTKPATPEKTQAPAPPGPKKGTPAAPGTDPKTPRPKPSEKFIAHAFIPGTDQFWQMKNGFEEDHVVLGMAFKAGVDAALNRTGWKNQAEIANGGALPQMVADEELKESVDKWVRWFEWYISERRWTKNRLRLGNLLLNCKNEDQVTAIVNMGWGQLPGTHFDIMREDAVKRLQDIRAQKIEVEDAPNATPDIFEPMDAPTGTDTTGADSKDIPF